MGKCDGLAGDELAKCRNIKSDMGGWTIRLIGVIALLFGILVIWQPQYIVWLLGGLMILIGVLILFSQKTYLIPIVLLVAGGGILFYPAFLLYAVLIIALVLGFVIAFQEPRTTTKTGIGIGVAVLGVITWALPNLMGTILGIALVFFGIILLVGGNIGEVPVIGGEWKRLRSK
jgi:hypothetical protein